MQRVDRRDQLHHVALGDRLALLARQQLGDLLDVLDQHVGRAPHVASAVGERELGPERLHLGDVVDHRLHLLGRDRLDGADELAGGRVEGFELRPSPGAILWRAAGGSSPGGRRRRLRRAGRPLAQAPCDPPRASRSSASKPAIRRLVEALALNLGREQRLVGDPARLVVGVLVALPRPSFLAPA